MKLEDLLESGSVIGILGGGQLGKMFASAAHNLGYRCVVYDPDEGSPAGATTMKHIARAYDDKESLREFSVMCDVITLEFENVPDISMKYLEEFGALLRPSRSVLRMTRNRYREKKLVESCGLRCPKWRAISSLEELELAVELLGEGGVLKTAESGYDGKGQRRILSTDEVSEVWKSLNTDLAVYEQWQEEIREISVIIGQNGRGETASFEPTLNHHSNNILEMSLVPAGVSDSVRIRAHSIAETIAFALDLHGILAVEMFVTKDDEILVNEMAPRPHNSGHWTMDGAANSQYDLLLRTICNLPMPSTERLFDVEMINLLGEEINGWQNLLDNDKSGRLYIYGKKEVKSSRKMGHFTRRFPKTGS